VHVVVCFAPIVDPKVPSDRLALREDGCGLRGQGVGGILGPFNHDPTAAIFDVAELGAVGDWQDLLPALVRQLKALCSAGTAHVEMEG